MATYNEVLQQVQSWQVTDQLQLLQDLQKIVSQGVKATETNSKIPVVEIVERSKLELVTRWENILQKTQELHADCPLTQAEIQAEIEDYRRNYEKNQSFN